MESDKAHLEKEVESRTKELYLIHKVGQEILSTLNLDDVLQHLTERVCAIMKLEVCSILLFDENEGALTLKYARGLDLKTKEMSQTKIKPNESVSGWVYAHKESILVDDIEKDPRFAKVHDEKYYTKSFISVPIEIKKGTIGVINVNNKKSKEPFNQSDLRIMEELAVEAGIAIYNALLYKNLQDVYLKTITALASTIDARDHYTFNHSVTVSVYAGMIAGEMSLSKEDTDSVMQAAQLHDIGKIGISDSILSKPGKLTDEEWGEIKLHSLKGAEILSSLTFMKDVIEMVEQSHEWFNGSGYPKGLKGDEIKLGSRIIHLADAVDTMASKRAYHNEYPVEYIKGELEKGRGKQFDPKIVDVFLNILKKKPGLLSK
ncbi:MAG: hypothetical protein AUJ75_01335 [Candidatus Omnitrophica bacterium CG1_02_49_10]|nr:MAG: hypothetical protein AUJ75_01335 [Candidatus Omnitrophica bacterium CG1_02_49_10]